MHCSSYVMRFFRFRRGKYLNAQKKYSFIPQEVDTAVMGYPDLKEVFLKWLYVLLHNLPWIFFIFFLVPSHFYEIPILIFQNYQSFQFTVFKFLFLLFYKYSVITMFLFVHYNIYQLRFSEVFVLIRLCSPVLSTCSYHWNIFFSILCMMYSWCPLFVSVFHFASNSI
jgi:hypothetical protein